MSLKGAALQPISRGVLDWIGAIRADSVHVYGDPGLVRDLPSWFEGTYTRPNRVGALQMDLG
jgi:hypothetical protein